MNSRRTGESGPMYIGFILNRRSTQDQHNAYMIIFVSVHRASELSLMVMLQHTQPWAMPACPAVLWEKMHQGRQGVASTQGTGQQGMHAASRACASRACMLAHRHCTMSIAFFMNWVKVLLSR